MSAFGDDWLGFFASVISGPPMWIEMREVAPLEQFAVLAILLLERRGGGDYNPRQTME